VKERQARIDLEATFVRMAKVKTAPAGNTPLLGEAMARFYKGTVQRTRKFAAIGEVWDTLLPPDINEHCCLESFRAGTLTVLVDSSPHMYRLKQLLLDGLQKQILDLCRPHGLKKITLRPGRWYAGDEDDRKIVFSE